MITGPLRSKIDKLWEEFWTGGITNPLTVIEQISFLMFARLLDMRESTEEKKWSRKHKGKQFPGVYFPRDKQHLRWSQLKQEADGEKVLKIIRDEVFPHFRELGQAEEATTEGPKNTFNQYMKDATLMINKPSLLISAINMIDVLPLTQGDTKGDLYEYLLSKLTTAGINGQFRTPRHIIDLMVDLVLEGNEEQALSWTVGDPACGTGGFLVQFIEGLRRRFSSSDGIHVDPETGDRTYTGDLIEPHQWKHIKSEMFHGFDFDVTMLRIAAMNMMLHEIDTPDINYQDTLSTNFTDRKETRRWAEDAFDLILANPPFKGSLDEDDVHKALTGKVKTKKTELLFLVLMLRMLKLGGKCAVIVPAGVLEGSSTQHQKLRKMLVMENQLEAVISLPHSTFKPYASVATAILLFTKGGETQDVWAYKVEADGFSQDGVRQPIIENDLPDVRRQWSDIAGGTYLPRDGKHGWIPRKEIEENGFNLLPRTYLFPKPHSDLYPSVPLGDICSICKGGVGATKAVPGDYPLVTTAAELSTHNEHSFDCEGVCIPLVSSTGHGHASIKRITFMRGKFEAATIIAVVQPNDPSKLLPAYLFHYLQAFKDEVLVSQMRGAANVSLTLTKIAAIEIPVPPTDIQQSFVAELEESVQRIDQLKRQMEAEEVGQVNLIHQFRQRFISECDGTSNLVSSTAEGEC